MPVDQGAHLFWSLLTSWRAAAKDAGARLLVISPEGSVSLLARGLGAEIEVEAQRGGTFGQRLADAAARAFARGAGAVLLAGGDSPPPPRGVLRRAFSALQGAPARVVLAPSEDGGVNLIGLARPMPELLTAIVPGSSRVERNLAAGALEAGCELVRLPVGRDLDRAADVAHAWRLSLLESDWRPFRTLLRAVLAARPSAGGPALSLPSCEHHAAVLSRAPPTV